MGFWENFFESRKDRPTCTVCNDWPADWRYPIKEPFKETGPWFTKWGFLCWGCYENNPYDYEYGGKEEL